MHFSIHNWHSRVSAQAPDSGKEVGAWLGQASSDDVCSDDCLRQECSSSPLVLRSEIAISDHLRGILGDHIRYDIVQLPKDLQFGATLPKN